MKNYIAFNKRSIATARELAAALTRISGEQWRIIDDRRPKYPIKNLLRWGNSYFDQPCQKEIGTKVNMATNKLEMIRKLSSTDGVRTPFVMYPDGNSNIGDGTVKVFVRNEHDQVVYRSNWVAGDRYATLEINKKNEYRVHVFNGEVIGIYEKIPNDASVKIYKAENCSFRRLDRNSATEMNYVKHLRPMAKKAVECLGLLFGGVDALRDEAGNFYINEVNSAPSLNSLNVDRWAEVIYGYTIGEPVKREYEVELSVTETFKVKIKAKDKEEAQRLANEVSVSGVTAVTKAKKVVTIV